MSIFRGTARDKGHAIIWSTDQLALTSIYITSPVIDIVRFFHISFINKNTSSKGGNNLSKGSTNSGEDIGSTTSMKKVHDEGKHNKMELVKKPFLIPRPPNSILSPTKLDKEVQTKPAKDINEITADYKNPQGIIKQHNVKPVESTYVANRPLEPLVRKLLYL